MDLNKFKDKPSGLSAVMVLYERSSDSLILTKRSEHLHAHPGEICFPGGVWDKEDTSLYATALRELEEELGITQDRVTLIRELHPQETLLGTRIHPWFASIESVTPYYLNPDEVTQLLLIPMPLVQSAQNYREIVVEKNGLLFKSCEFLFKDDWIWGATAKIMKQLIIAS